jgi:hypothetical protein
MGDSRYGRCASPAQEVFAEADRPMMAVRMVGILIVEVLETRISFAVVEKMFLYHFVVLACSTHVRK